MVTKDEKEAFEKFLKGKRIVDIAVEHRWTTNSIEDAIRKMSNSRSVDKVLPDRGIDTLFIEDILDNEGEEIWAHVRSGKMISVYERCDVYVRYHEYYHNDMVRQGHCQMDWNHFKDTYKLIGKLEKK